MHPLSGQPGSGRIFGRRTDMADTKVLRLCPIQISLRDVGPFATPDFVVIPFLGPHRTSGQHDRGRHRSGEARSPELSRPLRLPTPDERDRSLANLCFFHEVTGSGITTVLDCIFALWDLTSPTGARPGRAASKLGIRPESEVQLDLLATCDFEGRRIECVLSLWIGGTSPPLAWSDSLASEKPWGATEWAAIAFDPIGLEPNEGTNLFGRALLEAVRAAEGMAAEDETASRTYPGAADGCRHMLPTVLRFGRGALDRGGGYAVARSLSLEPPMDEQFERSLRGMPEAERESFLLELSDAVLVDGEAAPPRFLLAEDGSGLALAHGGRLHSLSTLNAPERTLLALHAAVLLHRTRSTIVLIEGIDGGFHTDDLDYLHQSLARIIEQDLGSIVMVAARSPEAFMSFVEHPFGDRIVIGGARTAGF